MDYWKQILIVLGGNATLIVVLAWLGKSLLSHFLSKDLDKFKGALNAEYTIASEKLKHELKLIASEHEVRFQKLHEKRADVIAEIHRLIREVHAKMRHLSLFFIGDMDEKPKKEVFDKVMEASGNLYNYFYENSIYLPEKLWDTTEKFVMSVRREAEKFMRIDQPRLWSIVDAPLDETLKLREKWREEHSEAWEKNRKFFDEELPKVKRELEREFRRLMGDRD